jgi:hypothetical protein
MELRRCAVPGCTEGLALPDPQHELIIWGLCHTHNAAFAKTYYGARYWKGQGAQAALAAWVRNQKSNPQSKEEK